VNGGSRETYFAIRNLQHNSTLNITNVTITGANAADFAVSQQPASSVQSGDFANHTSMYIKFDPTAAGTRSALVTINNNDPDESEYTFAVRGTGVNGLPVAGPDLLFLPGDSKALRTKYNPKKDLTKIRWTVLVANEGPVPVISAEVKAIVSQDGYLDSTDLPVATIVLKKPLPAWDPNKPKFKKLKVKGLVSGLDSAFMFAQVTPIPLSAGDNDWLSSTTFIGFATP
jgi:hypothetical protein